MAKKNEILLAIALEGDQDVKSRLQAVGEVGKKSLGNIEKNISDAKSGLSGLSEPLSKVREALAPLLSGAGAGSGLGNIVNLGGLFSRFTSGLLSPAGLVAGLTGALAGMAKLGEETDRSQARLRALGGGGKKAFDDLNESAKKIGTSRENLQQGLEDFLIAKRTSQQKGPFQYAPGYSPPDDQFTANVIGGKPTSIGTRADFEAAQRTLFAGSKVDHTKSEDAIKAINDLFSSLYANKGLTADAVRSFERVSPSDANRLANVVGPSVGRGFPNAGALSAFLDKQKSPTISPETVFRSLAKDEPNALRDAAAAHGLSDAFDNLKGATGRLTETFAGDHANLTKGVDSLAKLVDTTAEKIEKFTHEGAASGGKAPNTFGEVFTNKDGDLLGRFVGYLRSGADGNPGPDEQGKNPFAAVTDYLGKALLDPGAIQERQHDQPASPLEAAAADQQKAAGQLSQAAGDLSKVASDNKKPDGKTLGPSGAATPPPVSAPGIIEDITTHSGVYPNTQVSGNGAGPENIPALNKMLRDQKVVGEYEGDKQIEFTKSIREQLGLPTSVGADDPGERLFPGGPSRHRYEPDPNYQPAQLGTYDENQNFIPNKRQPYARSGDTFDTKGGGNNNPIYNFGQPQPLDFPGYTKSLRETLPDVPLPTPRPVSELEQPQQVATSLQSAIQSVFDNFAANAGSLNPTDTKVTEPPTGGIRGEGQQESSSNVAALNNAAGEAAEGLRTLAEIARAAGFGSGAAPTAAVHVATGGLIRHLDGGGKVNGPGTATSDSIPAMLSDGEYVIKTSSARKIGRSTLDWLNAGGYADGGAIARKLQNVRRRYAVGGYVSPDEVHNYPGTGFVHARSELGPGDHQITYDPGTGGANIDGADYLPGHPLLDDPIVQQAIARSKAEAGSGQSKRRHKSDFTGVFGGHAFDTPGGFAAGGAVGSIPHLAIGGGLDFSSLDLGSAPTLDDIGAAAAAGPSSGNYTVDLRTNHGDFKMMAPDDVARQMSRAATASAPVQTSPRPGWWR